MKHDLMDRTKEYALQVIELYSTLPDDEVARVLGKQLLRSGTSVGAQYREAQRAKSPADFVSKIEGALQELEATRYWLELIDGADLLPLESIRPLQQESTELIAILVTIAKNTKSNR
ncbi:MAG: four helix bundle protein [Chthoniobacteraceae bacterium]